MNVELITMDKDVAKAKLTAYRKAIAARHHGKAATMATKEYDAIENAYRVAAQGKPLIELSKAMAVGGWDEKGRPRFAVHRADLKRVQCYVDRDEVRFSDSDRRPYLRTSLLGHQFLRREMPGRPEGVEPWLRCTAIVPMVPPDAP